jgi:hypothetical protein
VLNDTPLHGAALVGVQGSLAQPLMVLVIEK